MRPGKIDDASMARRPGRRRFRTERVRVDRVVIADLHTANKFARIPRGYRRCRHAHKLIMKQTGYEQNESTQQPPCDLELVIAKV